MDNRRVETLWSHVHWLTVLGQLGSFTAAAQRLNVSKAAMSARIAELERAAGVPLVQRTTRSVRLTEAGQQLADATSGAFEAIGTAFAGIKDLAASPRGRLRITAPVALARQQLVPRLPEFLRAHPEVRIELDLSDRLVPLAQEGFDLAIRHTPAPPETHVAWTLCATASVLVASRAYLRRRGTPSLPDELSGHDCLHYLRPGDAPAWQLLPRAGTAAAKVTVPVGGCFAANNSEALREAALGGLGIALLPDFSAQAALASGKLLHVLPDWVPVGSFGEHLYAIRPYTPYVPRAVQALVGYLREAFKPGFGAA
ncbi:LysR family transcriptional regulator [Aquabacterium sp.]|uniref:LysR family transcriptional regulator n=1 Tax=Aquabacterium sp. TaxID=1872578 RepID=UPI002C2B236A|nr:LysR family transcriptional regulator [Aquabacterium sp.]HSW07574.1 LysR family transcriptional regulator [Aquabacterium sp.]